MDLLIHDTINRGAWTAISSALTMNLVGLSGSLEMIPLKWLPVLSETEYLLVHPWDLPRQQSFVLLSCCVEPVLMMSQST